VDYILHEIEWAKLDIETLQKKINKERAEKLENWQIACKMLQFDIGNAERTIEREKNVELPKLLNDPNEIIRKDAQARYDEYLKSDDKTRRRQWL
jgi:hypothetical protein